MAEHFEILAARHADSVVVMNEPVRQLSIERGVVQEHLRVAPNAVDVEKFAPSADSSGSVVGFIGSFVDYEGIWLIVLAAAELLERGVEVQVRLVGDGSEYPRVEKLVDEMGLADHVMLTGRVPHDQVIREYEEIDILVYPRLPTAATTTITPLKPFEALRWRRPWWSAMSRPCARSPVTGRELWSSLLVTCPAWPMPSRGSCPTRAFAVGSVAGPVNGWPGSVRGTRSSRHSARPTQTSDVQGCDHSGTIGRQHDSTTARCPPALDPRPDPGLAGLEPVPLAATDAWAPQRPRRRRHCAAVSNPASDSACSIDLRNEVENSTE